MRKKHTNSTFFWIVISLVAVIIFGRWWFSLTPNILVDGDELVWVLDAEFYEHRVNGNWSKFAVPTDEIILWKDERYRLIDQPQFGKYVFGFLLSAVNIRPWAEPNKVELYENFSTLSLETSTLSALPTTVGLVVAKAVSYMRQWMTVFGFGAVIVMSAAVAKLNKRIWTGLVMGVLLLTHPTVVQYFHLAIPTSFEMLVAAGVFVLLLQLLVWNGENQRQKMLLGWIVSGIGVALLVTTKLYWAIIFSFPLVYLFCSVVRAFIAVHFDDQSPPHTAQKNWLMVALGYMLFIVVSATTVFVIEPILWKQPFQGAVAILSARFEQQARFAKHFNDFSPPKTAQFLFEQFLLVSPFTLGKFFLTVLVVFGIHFMYKKSRESSLFLTISTFFMWVFVTNLYYASVGFDRYALPSICVLTVISVFGLMELLQFGRQKIRFLYEKKN